MTHRVFYFELQVDSSVLGSFTRPLIYAFADNTAFCAQVLYPQQAFEPLRDLAAIRVTNGVAAINREGNSRYLALKFNIEGRDMGSVVDEAIRTVTAEVKPPDSYYFVWGGEFENQQRAIARLRRLDGENLLYRSRAGRHDHHAISQEARFVDRVRDEDDRLLQFRLQFQKHRLHIGADQRIKRRIGFVHQ